MRIKKPFAQPSAVAENGQEDPKYGKQNRTLGDWFEEQDGESLQRLFPRKKKKKMQKKKEKKQQMKKVIRDLKKRVMQFRIP